MECNFLCEICGAKFVTSGRFANHYQAKHTEHISSQLLQDALDLEYSSVGSNPHFEETETPVIQPEPEQFFSNESEMAEASICLYDEDDNSSTLSADSTYNEETNFGLENEEESAFNDEVSFGDSVENYFRVKLPAFSTISSTKKAFCEFMCTSEISSRQNILECSWAQKTWGEYVNQTYEKERIFPENKECHFTSESTSSIRETGINVEAEGDYQRSFLGEDFDRNFDFINALETPIRESMLNPPTMEFQFKGITRKLLDIVPQPDAKTPTALKRFSETEPDLNEVKESVWLKKTRCQRSAGDQDQAGDENASSVMTREQPSPNFAAFINSLFPFNQVPVTKCVARDDERPTEKIPKISAAMQNIVIDLSNSNLVNTRMEQNKSSNKDTSEGKECNTMQKEEAATVVRQKSDRASEIGKELSHEQQQENTQITEKPPTKTQPDSAVKNINRAPDVLFVSPLRNIQIKKVIIPGRNEISDARHRNIIYRAGRSSSISNLSNSNIIANSGSSQSSVIAPTTETVLIRNKVGILDENPPRQMPNVNLTVDELSKKPLQGRIINLTGDELLKESLQTLNTDDETED